MPTFTLRKSICTTLLLVSFFSAKAQDKTLTAKTGKANFANFTSAAKQTSPDWKALNVESSNNPDASLQPRVPDPSGMVELYDKRTLSTKYFVNPAKQSEFVVEQSSGPIHYQDRGQWVTIDTRLTRKYVGVFEASRQQDPVGFDVQRKESYIRSQAGTIYFNNWELSGKKNGVTSKLASANWSNYTVGDDGMYVTNIFPGMDASMTVNRGSVKTSFIVKSNQFASYNELQFTDAFEGSANSKFAFASTSVSGNTGVGKLKYKVDDKAILEVGTALGYTETMDEAHRLVKEFPYTVVDNKMAINVDANYINTQLQYGKVIIDPVVNAISVLPAASITGSMNCGSITNSCNYVLPVTVPGATTVTAVAIKFQMQVNAPLQLSQAAFSISAPGGCGATTQIAAAATPILLAPGTVYTPDDSIVAINPAYNQPGFWNALSATLLPCMPAAACPAPVLPFTLRFWNTYCGGAPGCANTYASAAIDFSIRVRGNQTDFVPARISRSIPTQLFCEGQSITLTRNVGTGGFAPYTYSWAPSGQTTQTATVTPTGTTIYTSVITDACGRSVTDTTQLFLVTNNVPPTVVTPLNVCQFDNTPLTAGGPNLRWFTTASGGVGSPVAPIPPTTPGTYVYFVSSLGQCGESPRARMTVVVIAKPAPPTVASPVGVCQYAQIQLTASGQNLKWYETQTGGFGTPTMIPNTNYVDSFYYYVTQTINGCESDRARIRLFVNYKPNGIVLPSRLFVCEGDTALFQYYGNALPDAIYNWSTSRPGNEIIFGQGTPGPMIVRFDSAGLRQVNVQINNKGCLSEVGSQTISVRPNPRITYNVQENVCQGEILNVALNAISPAIDSFKYIFPGGNIVYGAGSGGPYGIVYNTPGDYIIGSMSYSRTCPSRFYYDTIAVRPLGDARITPNRTDICAGDSILFRASGIPDSNTRYVWTPNNFFANGNIYQSWGVVKAAGYVKLTATSQYGCVGQDSVLINAKVCCEMFFPNAFSPNNDGKNDVFKPVTNGHQEIKNFRVINRWGQVVYETKEDRAGWNGVYNGRDQDAGTFYYYIRYNCRDGNGDLEQKGEVLLLR